MTFERLHHVQLLCPPGGEEEAGHPVEWDPHLPGHRRLYAHDAHGNRLEFLEKVKD